MDGKIQYAERERDERSSWLLLPRPVLLILNECNIQHIPASGVFAVNVNPSYAQRCSSPHKLCT